MEDLYQKNSKKLTGMIRKVIEASPEITQAILEAAEDDKLCVVIDICVQIGTMEGQSSEDPKVNLNWKPTPHDQKFMTAMRIADSVNSDTIQG